MGRRGPKKQNGKREPNGQISRKVADVASRHYEKLEREEVMTIAVAVAAREHLFGVSIGHSRDQKAGSYVGRLCLQGSINNAQYDAAMTFLAQKHGYDIAMRTPRQPGAIDLNATKGGNGDYENVALTLRTKAQYEAALKAIMVANCEPSNRGCNLYAALDYTVLRDQVLDHLLSDTRVALNALVRHYGLNGQRRAA